MKHCPNCNEEVEKAFDVCWNCNYSFVEEKVVQFEETAHKKSGKRNIKCVHCSVKMRYAGNYKFHEGSRFGFFGNFWEAFVNRESFDLYVCPTCGKVEFFVPME